MAEITQSRVFELSTTTGTGAFTLAGAPTGFRAFSAVCSVSDTFRYVIEGVTNGVQTGEWEVGTGTYSGANTLTRTTVEASSNAGAAVNFSAGTKRVSLIATSTGGTASGTAFPGSPATDTRFYRTDRDLEYFYDGTRWLSANQYTLGHDTHGANITATTTTYRAPSQQETYDIWLETLNSSVYRDAAGEWDIKLSKRSAANADTLITTVDGAGDATTTWVSKSTSVAALYQNSAHKTLAIEFTEVSGTSNLTGSVTLTYRLVG